MSTEDRLSRVEDDVAKLKLDQGLMAQSMHNLEEKFDKGVTGFTSTLSDQFQAARQERQEERRLLAEKQDKDRADQAQARADRTKLLTKVIGVLTTALTLAGGAGGVAYYSAGDSESVPVEAPAP